MIRLITVVACAIVFTNADNVEYSLFTAKAEKGDGVYSLLRRYDLLNDCNLEHFYAANYLKPDQGLHAGKNYTLPILLFKYDGTSLESSLDMEDPEKAQRINSYNQWLLESGLRKQSIEESKIIWTPFHEMRCMAEKVAHVKTVGLKSFPVFGSAYEYLDIKSDNLKDKVFFVESGHGGPDPGAHGHFNGSRICEDEYAYDVALRLARLLIQHGAHVELIVQDPNDGIRDEQILHRDSDEKCNGESMPVNQKARLAQRTDYVNYLAAKYRKKGLTNQKFISIHVDSQLETRRQDVYFFHSPLSKDGKRFAHNLLNTFRQKYAYYQSDRGYGGTIVSNRTLYVLNNTVPPAVLVELANIRNSEDHKRIVFPSNRQFLAQWLFEGMIK